MYILGFHILGTSYEKTGQPVSTKATIAPKQPVTKKAPVSRQIVQPRPNTPLNQRVISDRAESERVRREAAASVPGVIAATSGTIPEPDQSTDRGPGLSDAEILATLNAPTELLERDAVLSAKDPARKTPSDTVFDYAQDTPTTEIEVITPSSPSKSGVIRAGTRGKNKIDRTRENTSEAAERALDQLLNRRPKKSK